MMERLKRGFYKLLLCLTLITASVTCAAAALSKEYPKKFNLEYSRVPVVEGGIFFFSVSSLDDLSEVAGEFQGRTVAFFPNHDTAAGIRRFSAIVGVDYGAAEGSPKLSVQAKFGDQAFERVAKIRVMPGNFPSERLRVQPRKLEPTEKDKIQIAKDRKVLARIYGVKTLNRFWDPPAVLPIESDVTSVYGTSRIYNGKKHNVHLGTDLRAPIGTPILAPFSGMVAVSRYLFYTGYTIILDHGYGLFTIYGHMSKLRVKEGSTVKKGQVMGLSGATGRVSGPHLHWGVHLHGAKIDPLVLVQSLKAKTGAP